VPISYDENGYFDRESPSEECQFQFKPLMEDSKVKVRDEGNRSAAQFALDAHRALNVVVVEAEILAPITVRSVN